MTFRVGDKVKTIENHLYIKITKKQLGTVVSFWGEDKSVEVEFKGRKIIFQASELKKVPRAKKNTK